MEKRRGEQQPLMFVCFNGFGIGIVQREPFVLLVPEVGDDGLIGVEMYFKPLLCNFIWTELL